MIVRVTQKELGVEAHKLPSELLLITLITLVALMAWSFLVGVLITLIITTSIG